MQSRDAARSRASACGPVPACRCAAGRLDERVGGGVEVGEVIAGDELRRHQFVTQAGIDGESGTHSNVVLYIEEVHVLVVVDDPEVVELIGGARAGQEVGEICCLACACIVGAAAILAEASIEVFRP